MTSFVGASPSRDPVAPVGHQPDTWCTLGHTGTGGAAVCGLRQDRLVLLDDARDAGALLGRAESSDVVDALVALLALPSDQVLTSDPEDLSRLMDARELEVRVVTV